MRDDHFERFSFFFSREQWWTEDGPDGRHGRSVALTARTPEGDPATSHRPATVVVLAKGETSAWRIAPVACATVSHELVATFQSYAVRRNVGDVPSLGWAERSMDDYWLK